MTNPSFPSTSKLPGPRAFVLLFGLGLVVFGPAAWSAEFLNYRDALLFGGGGAESALAARGPLGLLVPTASLDGAFTPLAHLSLWIDLQLFGAGPTAIGAHLHSLVLRVLAAFVLARLAARLGLSVTAAVAGAALWLAHPALVGTTAVVADRREVLGALLGFGALGCVVRDAGGGVRPGRVAAAAGLTVAAGYAAVGALTVGLLAPFVGWLSRATPRRIGAAALASSAAAVIVAVHHHLLAAGAGAFVPADWSHVPGLVARDLVVSVWPVGLNLLHPEVASLRALALPTAAAIGLLVGAVGFALWAVRRAPVVGAVSAAWLTAGLAVHAALPADGPAVADVHALYGVAVLALGLAALPVVGARAAILLTIPAAVLGIDRARELSDSRRAWEASLAAAPESSVAALNLAHARAAVGELGLATWRALATRAARSAERPDHRLRAERALLRIALREDDLDAAADHALAAAAAAAELGDGAAARAIECEARLEAARQARRVGRDAVAREQFERARAIDPGAPRVLAFAAALQHAEAMVDASGRVAADDPRIVAAEALLDRAAAADPGLYEVPWTRGVLAHAKGELLRAEKFLRAAIALDPGRAEAHLSRADLFLGQPDMAAAAERAIREGLEAARRLGVLPDAGLRYRLALALTQQGRIEDAREHYERYLELRPDDSAARTGLATVLAAIGMRQLHQLPPDKIEELAERVLELDPEHPKGQLLRAITFRTQARLAEALILFEKVLELLPDDPDVVRLYAETLRDRGWQLKLDGESAERAWSLFRRFLAVAPDGVETEAVERAVFHEWRRELRAGQEALVAGDLDAAERALRQCLELRPGVETPNLQLGMVLMQRGEGHLDAALQCFVAAERGQRAAGWDPSLAVYYQVRTLLLAGEDATARSRAETYLAAPVDEADAETLQRLRALVDR